MVSVFNPYAPAWGSNNLPILLTVTAPSSGILQSQIQLLGPGGAPILAAATGIAASDSALFVAASGSIYTFARDSVQSAAGAATLVASSVASIGEGAADGGLSVFKQAGCVLRAVSASGVVLSAPLSGCGTIGGGWTRVLDLGLESVKGFVDMGNVGAGAGYAAVLQCRNTDHFRCAIHTYELNGAGTGIAGDSPVDTIPVPVGATGLTFIPDGMSGKLLVSFNSAYDEHVHVLNRLQREVLDAVMMLDLPQPLYAAAPGIRLNYKQVKVGRDWHACGGNAVLCCPVHVRRREQFPHSSLLLPSPLHPPPHPQIQLLGKVLHRSCLFNVGNCVPLGGRRRLAQAHPKECLSAEAVLFNKRTRMFHYEIQFPGAIPGELVVASRPEGMWPG